MADLISLQIAIIEAQKALDTANFNYKIALQDDKIGALKMSLPAPVVNVNA